MTLVADPNALDSIILWYQGLSLFGKIFFPLAAVAASVVLIVFVKFMYRAIQRIRRFVRRKIIPKNIDLRLDRDLAPRTKVEPSVDQGAEQAEDPKYGKNLKERIERMRQESPFKPQSENDA